MLGCGRDLIIKKIELKTDESSWRLTRLHLHGSLGVLECTHELSLSKVEADVALKKCTEMNDYAWRDYMQGQTAVSDFWSCLGMVLLHTKKVGMRQCRNVTDRK